MTDPAIIAASYSAEKSYTHNLDDVIDASDAVGAWGTAKESTTKLVDLSGNGNVADIHGPMPAEGFIQGRRFDGVDDYLDCGNGNLGITSGKLISIFKTSDSSIVAKMLMHKYIGGTPNSGYYIKVTNLGAVTYKYGGDTDINISSSSGYNDGKIHVAEIEFENDIVIIKMDGVEVNDSNYSNLQTNLTAFKIGLYSFKGIIFYTQLQSLITNDFFNTLARLPFWSVNYTDYPDNVTEYTDRLPYSSSIISSGTFKVDDDKLQCVSAGTITYSASYEFDGSEYIKVEIGGVEYAGTGTITQGNTTVSVAQGSNKITIQAGTADTIDSINIQFRAEV